MFDGIGVVFIEKVKAILFFIYFHQFDEMGVIEDFDKFVFGAVLGDLLLG